MSYDNPNRLSLHFGTTDFGATDVTREIALPTEGGAFMGAKVVGVLFSNVSELFAAATTSPRVDVGIIGGAAAAYFSSGDLPLASLTVGDSEYLEDDGDQVDVPINDATNVNKVLLSFIAGVGTPTGIADVTLLVDVY